MGGGKHEGSAEEERKGGIKEFSIMVCVCVLVYDPRQFTHAFSASVLSLVKRS